MEQSAETIKIIIGEVKDLATKSATETLKRKDLEQKVKVLEKELNNAKARIEELEKVVSDHGWTINHADQVLVSNNGEVKHLRGEA